MNRGRIQAQGKKCEKSESWSQTNIPTKNDGNNKIDSLKKQLTKKELTERKQCIDKVIRFIKQAPVSGYDSTKLSYTPIPPQKDIRVDVEIIKGKAFRDDD